MSLNFRSLCFLPYCVSYSSSFLFHVYADTMDMFLGYVRCKSYGMVYMYQPQLVCTVPLRTGTAVHVLIFVFVCIIVFFLQDAFFVQY